MWIGAYCLGSGLLVLIGFLALGLGINPHGRWRNRQARVRGYLLASLLTALAALGVVLLLGTLTGLITWGAAQDFAVPGSFSAAGALGWLLLVLLALGLLAPILLALRYARPDKDKL